MVAVFQHMPERHNLVVYSCPGAVVAYVGVDAVCEVEHGSPFREFHEVAFRCEHKHLVLVQVHLELVDYLQVVLVFQSRAYAVKPFVKAAFALHALVTPVGRQSALGYFVHALRADLHLHPFVFRPQHGDVQAFVAVRLRHAQPVAHTLGVGLVHVGDDGEHLPALHFFHLLRRVEYYAYCEEVVHALEAALLLLHLLPDAVYALGPSLHVELEACLLQLLVYRGNEAFYVCVAALFGGVKLLLYHVVGVVLEVFQAQVLKFALQFVQAQFVRQRGVQVAGLLADFGFSLDVLRVADLPHQVYAVGYHDKYDAHVLCERQQQVAKVLALDNGAFLVQFLYFAKSVYYARHAIAEHAAYLLRVLCHGVQQYCQYAVALQPYLVNGDGRSLQTRYYGIEAEHVAPHAVAADGRFKVFEYVKLVVAAY